MKLVKIQPARCYLELILLHADPKNSNVPFDGMVIRSEFSSLKMESLCSLFYYLILEFYGREIPFHCVKNDQVFVE